MSSPLIEYRRISLHPTCIGNERIRLETDGRIYHAKNSRECEEGQLWSAGWQYKGKVDANVLAAFIDLVASSSLIDLPEIMGDSSVEDGSREELAVSMAGVSYCRRLHNAEHPAFRLVVRQLRGVLMSTLTSPDATKDAFSQ